MESGFVILAAGMLDAGMKSFTEAPSWQAAAKGSGSLPHGRGSVKRWLIPRYLRNRARQQAVLDMPFRQPVQAVKESETPAASSFIKYYQ
ncbi:MAG: hypothetical protein ABSG25_06465 [Bryobacteraceae bacterium]